MKAVLETGLAELPGIRAASASTDTGNVLTDFDPAVPAERVGDRILALLRGDILPETGLPFAPDWHARAGDVVTAELDGSESAGLTTDEVAKRLAVHGSNGLAPPSLRAGFTIFLGQFQTLPVGMLVAAGVFSLVTGGLVEAAAILAVVGFNAGLGTVIEGRSERTIRSLGAASSEPAHVMRDGVALEIAADSVVPGDLILLLPGTVVPADARVLSGQNLFVSEAMLTGESLPVAKRPAPVARTATLADRSSMVYRGTAVTGGSGTAIVVATGAHTEMGRIQRLVADAASPQTPMQRQLDQLGRQLVWASLATCGVVMGVGALRG
ncbi:MAG: HAD-IC family P-type ATPase, partial [Acetobacteraceae bacterium]|nr:HAD-IC family P-type ATPase [Acetobacteraceae bacterium]